MDDEELITANRAKTITLKGLRLAHLEDDNIVFRTEGLTGINLSENNLIVLPPLVRTFAHLVILDLSYNNLRSLPREISCWVALRRLYLQHNELHALPAELGDLTELHELNVAHNHLIALPATIMHITGLDNLDLSYNPLTAAAQPKRVMETSTLVLKSPTKCLAAMSRVLRPVKRTASPSPSMIAKRVPSPQPVVHSYSRKRPTSAPHTRDMRVRAIASPASMISALVNHVHVKPVAIRRATPGQSASKLSITPSGTAVSVTAAATTPAVITQRECEREANLTLEQLAGADDAQLSEMVKQRFAEIKHRLAPEFDTTLQTVLTLQQTEAPLGSAMHETTTTAAAVDKQACTTLNEAHVANPPTIELIDQQIPNHVPVKIQSIRARRYQKAPAEQQQKQVVEDKRPGVITHIGTAKPRSNSFSSPKARSQTPTSRATFKSDSKTDKIAKSGPRKDSVVSENSGISLWRDWKFEPTPTVPAAAPAPQSVPPPSSQMDATAAVSKEDATVVDSAAVAVTAHPIADLHAAAKMLTDASMCTDPVIVRAVDEPFATEPLWQQICDLRQAMLQKDEEITVLRLKLLDNKLAQQVSSAPSATPVVLNTSILSIPITTAAVPAPEPATVATNETSVVAVEDAPASHQSPAAGSLDEEFSQFEREHALLDEILTSVPNIRPHVPRLDFAALRAKTPTQAAKQRSAAKLNTRTPLKPVNVSKPTSVSKPKGAVKVAVKPKPAVTQKRSDVKPTRPALFELNVTEASMGDVHSPSLLGKDATFFLSPDSAGPREKKREIVVLPSAMSDAHLMLDSPLTAEKLDQVDTVLAAIQQRLLV
eukprot:TRINITY_DN2009_c1_g1_i1.p1 TRINITY_DN2009_c1_g1~~TRINITY_DN2009_c1_g1_i1.p1  ORF type:complete len:846 (+),score=191.31 TRINITY_DN2009_c1_g1_i1:55-2538(+)